MDRKIGVIAAVVGAILVAIAAFAWVSGKDGKSGKFLAQVVPIAVKVSERVRGAAAATAGDPAAMSAKASAYLTDFAGLGADLKALYPDGDRQQAMVTAAQSWLGAAGRFVKAQAAFAQALLRLAAARAKEKESMDARQRTSPASLDFWKESHDRVVKDLDKVRAEVAAARTALAQGATGARQAAEAAAAVLGPEAVVPADVFAAHEKSLAAIPL